MANNTPRFGTFPLPGHQNMTNLQIADAMCVEALKMLNPGGVWISEVCALPKDKKERKAILNIYRKHFTKVEIKTDGTINCFA